MKKFFLKHINYLIFCLIVIVSAFYFKPSQEKYYLHSDIENFKSRCLLISWLAAGLIILVITTVFVYKNTKNIKRTLIASVFASLMGAFILFLMQDLFIASGLFVNCQFVLDRKTKKFVVDYWAGMEKNKSNFNLYDIKQKDFIFTFTDENMINKTYNPALNSKDTISVEFNKGLFGIDYFK